MRITPLIRILWSTPVVAALGILIVAGAYLMTHPRVSFAEASTIGKGAETFKILSNRFEDLAREKGALYAFQVLKIAELPPSTDTHLLGHGIGDVFYTQKGVPGIADCTQDFRNACSHTIVIGALNEFGSGDSTLAMIDDACKKAPGGLGAYTMCYHGLGHGVFAYFGYDLNKTVAYCQKMGTAQFNDEQFTQCVGGVIMELMSGGGHDRDAWERAREKYMVKDQPLAPCDTSLIPEKAKGYCYLYITPRLFGDNGIQVAHPDPATFPRAFEYCEAIPVSSSRARDACFGGLGREFVGLAAERDIRAIDQLDSAVYARAAGWCDLAVSRDGKESCLRQEVESLFWGGENDPDASFRFCTSVPDSLEATCLRELSGVIGHYLRGEVRSQWCLKLPEEYRDKCTA
ncbi:MAG: hypothetical protein KBD06_01900 [Candidatus Pacebacteria bacterium]|nr:hypothetical protein [Candidatus Paceibacterota bacterium]